MELKVSKNRSQMSKMIFIEEEALGLTMFCMLHVVSQIS